MLASQEPDSFQSCAREKQELEAKNGPDLLPPRANNDAVPRRLQANPGNQWPIRVNETSQLHFQQMPVT